MSSAEFSNRKKRIKILILGPQRPPNAEKRLYAFKRCLLQSGYDNVKLVADFPDVPKFHPDQSSHFTLKSQNYIKNWADVLVFVFLCNCDNQGVANELTFASLMVTEKLNVSVVLSEKGVQLSSLTKGPINLQKIDSDEFSNDVELCEMAKGYVTNYIYVLYWKI